MSELVITRGLPASGKTTWAREWVAEDSEQRARINRDDFRHMMFGIYWPLTPVQEAMVTVVQLAAISLALRNGISVVCDDTNLRLLHAVALTGVAKDAGASWRVEEFKTSPDECIARDNKRRLNGERYVGDAAILGMASRYNIPESWPAELVA